MIAGELENTADEVSAYMKLLSAPSRLMILCQLVEGERSSGELSELVGMKAPAISQHLGRLRNEGIVSARRLGQHIFYSIADENALAIMNFLYETFCGDSSEKQINVKRDVHA